MTKKDFTKALSKKIALALSVGMFSILPYASALPTGAEVTNGNAAVSVNGSTMDITAGTLNNIINWDTFSIAKGEMVNFDANNYLNLVRGSEASNIFGAMNGGGMVFLINPNGILFGEGAAINVNSLTASTRPIDAVDTEAFLGLGSFESYDAAGRKDAIYGLTTQEEVTYPEETETFYWHRVTAPSDINGRIVADGGSDLGPDGETLYPREMVSFQGKHTIQSTVTHTVKPVLPYSSVNYINNMGGEISVAGLTNVNNASEIRLEAGTIILKNTDVLNNITEAVTGNLVLGAASEQNGINIYDGEMTRGKVIEYYDYDNYGEHSTFSAGSNDEMQYMKNYTYGYNYIETDTVTPEGSNDWVPRNHLVTDNDITWASGIDAGLKANLSKVVTVPVHDYTRYEQGATKAHTYYGLPWATEVGNTGHTNYSRDLGGPWVYANGTQSQYEILSYSTRPFLTAANIAQLGSTGDYILSGDIDLENTKRNPTNFSGSLNGLGYTIKNLTLEVTDSNVGFFSVIDGGKVSNLNFENVSVVNTAADGNTGALAGSIINGGRADNIHVLSGTITGAYNVGGIAGELWNGHIVNASNNAAISSSVDGSRLGGIAGDIIQTSFGTSSIDYAYNTGSITGAKSYAGGILGYSGDSASTIDHVYNLGTVKGNYINTSAGHVYNVGGIYGAANGQITATNAYYAEGTVLDNEGNTITGINIGSAEEKNAVAARIDAIWNTSLAQNDTPSVPDNPGQSDTPSVPDNPGQSDTPSVPDNPGQSDTPSVPDNPGQSDTPSVPDNPGQSDTPSVPDNPSQSDTPSVPDNPGSSEDSGSNSHLKGDTLAEIIHNYVDDNNRERNIAQNYEDSIVSITKNETDNANNNRPNRWMPAVSDAAGPAQGSGGEIVVNENKTTVSDNNAESEGESK